MLAHKGTVTLETPRLILRRIQVEDAQNMYQNWACDPDVTKFLTWQPHESPAATEELLKNWVQQYNNSNFYLWAIQPKTLGSPLAT